MANKTKRVKRRLFVQCKNSPNGRHNIKRWTDKGHVSLYCEHCNRVFR